MLSASLRVIPENWINPIPWHIYFAQPQPLEIDVGCGKGRFLLARARAHPEINFLGIDRMLRRIRKVDNKARRARLNNIRLFRMEAYYAVAYLVPPECVQTYYIFFPDPWPKKRHHEHRLFNPRCMAAIHRALQPAGQLHFATDHGPYFDEVRELFRQDGRFAEIPAFEPTGEERTDFELYYAGKTEIGRLSVVKR